MSDCRGENTQTDTRPAAGGIFPLPILPFLPSDLSTRGFEVLMVFDGLATLLVVWRFGGSEAGHRKRPPRRHDDEG